MKTFILNLLMALLWLFLSRRPNLATFALGYGLGFGMLWLFRPVLPEDGYLRRTLAFVRFLLRFAREFAWSNVQMAHAIWFRPRREIRPNFLTYDVSGLRQPEILLLSQCITLTPGTTTVDVTDDWRTLILHAFDARDPEAVRRGIDAGLRRAILEFMR